MLTSVRNRYVELEVRILILKSIRAIKIVGLREMLTRVRWGGEGGLTTCTSKGGRVVVLLNTHSSDWILCVHNAQNFGSITIQCFIAVSRISFSHTLI